MKISDSGTLSGGSVIISTLYMHVQEIIEDLFIKFTVSSGNFISLPNPILSWCECQGSMGATSVFLCPRD